MAQQGSFSRAMQPQLRVASCALQNAFSLFSFSAGQVCPLSPLNQTLLTAFGRFFGNLQKNFISTSFYSELPDFSGGSVFRLALLVRAFLFLYGLFPESFPEKTGWFWRTTNVLQSRRSGANGH